jgi:hypothetical protein
MILRRRVSSVWSRTESRGDCAFSGLPLAMPTV